MVPRRPTLGPGPVLLALEVAVDAVAGDRDLAPVLERLDVALDRVSAELRSAALDELDAAADPRPARLDVRVGKGQSSGIMLASAIASAAGFAIFSRFGRFMPSSTQRSISWKSSSIRVSEDTLRSTRPWA